MLKFLLFLFKCILLTSAFNGDLQIKELGEEQYHIIKG